MKNMVTMILIKNESNKGNAKNNENNNDQDHGIDNKNNDEKFDNEHKDIMMMKMKIIKGRE